MFIVLDAGHGGADPGGHSVGIEEKHLNLTFQPFLWKALADLGHRCAPTRIQDVTLHLSSRANYANAQGADCFVSIHHNASKRPSARGAWTLYCAGSERGKDLASKIQKEVAKLSPFSRSDSVYADGTDWTGGRTLAVLRRTRMPAVILELGFMTNEAEHQLLVQPDYRERLAATIAFGISSWQA